MSRSLLLALACAAALTGCQPALPPSTAGAPTTSVVSTEVTASVQGSVRWPGGQSMSKLRAMVHGMSEPAAVAATDMEGRFTLHLRGVKPGQIIKVFANGGEGGTLGTLAIAQGPRSVLQSSQVVLRPSTTVALFAMGRMIDNGSALLSTAPGLNEEFLAVFQALEAAAIEVNEDADKARPALALFQWTGQPGESAGRLSRDLVGSLPKFSGVFQVEAAKLQQALQKAIDTAKVTLPPGAELPVTFGDLTVGGLKPPAETVPVTPNTTGDPLPSNPSPTTGSSSGGGDNGIDTHEPDDTDTSVSKSSGPVTVTGNLEVPIPAN